MPVHITCPTCRQSFPVPTEVLGVDGHQVVVRMDRTELYGHQQACAANAGDQAAQAAAEPSKAVERPSAPVPVVAPAFVAKGKRPCTMCGASSPDCMASLANSLPCCGACGEGNTHPAPREDMACATWAAEHGTAR